MISITVDVEQFTRSMDELQHRQLPFAMSKALNAVALDVQTRERERLREVFTIRRSAFADRSVKITHFATKAHQYVTIGITALGKDSTAPNVFNKFEEDVVKTPFGNHGIAVPIKDHHVRRGILPNNQKPKAFRLHREGSRVVGDKGTYVVKLSDGRELLLQRKDLGVRAAKKAGRGTKADSTLLFIFVPRVKINPNLKFVPSADEVVARLWQQRFGEAFALAMSTAR